VEDASSSLLNGAPWSKEYGEVHGTEGGALGQLFQLELQGRGFAIQSVNLEKVVAFLVNSVHGLSTTAREESARTREELAAAAGRAELLEKRLEVTLAAASAPKEGGGEDANLRLVVNEMQEVQERHTTEIEALTGRLDALAKAVQELQEGTAEFQVAKNELKDMIRQNEKARRQALLTCVYTFSRRLF
jgi:hypothetical protein